MSARLCLVLGSGSARGWAHIGVIRELTEAGYTPDIVCGCSIGAFVGAAYANGDLDKLEHWVRSLTWQKVLKLLDVGFNGGLKQDLAERLGLGERDGIPSLVSVLTTSIHIMQTRIARSRLAGEPADVLLSPRLAHLALMDFHRADEAIAEGREAVKRMLPAIQSVLPR